MLKKQLSLSYTALFAKFRDFLMKSGLTINLTVHQDYSHIERALTSIIENTTYPLTIYVTINTGESAGFLRLKASFPDINYIVNSTPKGFAANHNHVLAIAKTPYIALLNDDIEIKSHTIEKLVNYLEQNKNVGLVSPRIMNPDGTPQQTAYSYPSLLRMIYKMSGLGHLTRQGSFIRNIIINTGLGRLLGVASLSKNQETQVVPVVVGVAMFVRREAYQQSGGMDEDTIVYGEEFTWMWRLKQSGWDIAINADAEVIHYNVDKDIRGWALAEHRKGMLNFFYRHRPRWQLWVLRFAIIFFHGLRGIYNFIFDRARASGDWMSVRAATWKPKSDSE